MSTAAAQYKAWCLYLFEHGEKQHAKRLGKDIKYIFGLPLRLESPTMLTTESFHILQELRPKLYMMKFEAPVHQMMIGSRNDFAMSFPDALAYVSFVQGSKLKVSVSFMVSHSVSIHMVHHLTLLYHVYINWLFKISNLVCKTFTITFSLVYCTDEEELYVSKKISTDLELSDLDVSFIHTNSCK